MMLPSCLMNIKNKKQRKEKEKGNLQSLAHHTLKAFISLKAINFSYEILNCVLNLQTLSFLT